jgi:hypothetical protein
MSDFSSSNTENLLIRSDLILLDSNLSSMDNSWNQKIGILVQISLRGRFCQKKQRLGSRIRPWQNSELFCERFVPSANTIQFIQRVFHMSENSSHHSHLNLQRTSRSFLPKRIHSIHTFHC